MSIIDLSVIIPIYNEEENISLLYERLTSALKPLDVRKEFLFVNDGSKDSSMELIRQLAEVQEEVKYIDFSRNFGHQIAVSAGLEYVKGRRVVIIDADLQDPPELIVDMWEKMDEGYEVVYAKRRKRANETVLKKWTAKWFYRTLASITSVEIPVDTGDFRIMDRKLVDILNRMPEQNKFIRGQISWAGFRQTYLEYDRDGRHAGETGYTYKKMFKFALDGITAFSNFPLKFATASGFVVSGISFLVILYTLIQRFIFKNYEPGWPSLMVSILFLGGIQLISIGIIGEYISRMAANIRNRPLFVVRDSNVSKEKVLIEDEAV